MQCDKIYNMTKCLRSTGLGRDYQTNSFITVLLVWVINTVVFSLIIFSFQVLLKSHSPFDGFNLSLNPTIFVNIY
jgi:hypothetical protein